MPANKYALLRYRIIDRCLSHKNFPNKEDLRQACEDSLYGSFGENISESTIEKDLFAMRNESDLGYYAPIAYSKIEKGYFYEDDNYSINELSLNEGDIEAIQFAAQTLNQFKDNPIFQQYENAIDKIVNRIKVSPDPIDKNLNEYIQFETTPVDHGNEFLTPILDSIRNCEILEIYYKKYSDDHANKYLLHPYLLKEYRNRWYLISFDTKREKYITFGLERIEKINKTGDPFIKDKTFRSDRFFKHSVGITEINSQPEKVVLEFNSLQASYAISQPIHSSQKILSRDNNKVQIELEVLETFELVQLILGYGQNVEVLAPKSLRNRIQKELRDSLSKY